MLKLVFVLALTSPLVPSFHRQSPSIVSEIPRDTHGKPATKRVHPDLIALRTQMRANPELPPTSFWMAVARCETAHGLNGQIQWRRGEHWKVTTVTGAMGIATSAWLAYGGAEYAPRAARASQWAQMIVANRIGFLGWQTTEYKTWEDRVNGRAHFRHPAGFSQGWGGKCREAWERRHGKP